MAGKMSFLAQRLILNLAVSCPPINDCLPTLNAGPPPNTPFPGHLTQQKSQSMNRISINEKSAEIIYASQTHYKHINFTLTDSVCGSSGAGLAAYPSSESLQEVFSFSACTLYEFDDSYDSYDH